MASQTQKSHSTPAHKKPQYKQQFEEYIKGSIRRGWYQRYKIEDNFIHFIEGAGLTPTEKNDFSTEKIVNYVEDFMDNHGLGEFDYIMFIVNECKKRQFLSRKLRDALVLAMGNAAGKIKDGYFDMDGMLEILNEGILRSPEFSRYTSRSRY